jgi:DHA2 family multidrug resistance protein
MRNIGGSFGIATMTTFLARRNQLHHNQLISHITPFDVRAQMALHGMQSWFQTHGSNSVDAGRKALGAIYGMVQQQAAMLSFVEAFWVMGVVFLSMAPLLLLLRNVRKLHPHVPKAVPKAPLAAEEAPESEPELAGALH